MSLDHGDGRPGIDVRLYPEPFGQGDHMHRGSVAVFLAGGTVCVLPVLPGYIGTVHVRDGRVLSLSYEVSAQLRESLHESNEERRAFAKRRALAATLSASRMLRRMTQADGAAHAAFLRGSKRADPTLGIYAAYAYAMAGDDAGARSVNSWFRQYDSLDPVNGMRRSPVPFDVAMLARSLSRDDAIRPPGIAPFCPLMSIGWSLLPSYIAEGTLHPAILDAGRQRLNSEWTCFRSDDVRPMLAAFEKGELQ